MTQYKENISSGIIVKKKKNDRKLASYEKNKEKNSTFNAAINMKDLGTRGPR